MKERKPIGAWVFFGICVFFAIGFLGTGSVAGFLLMFVTALAAMPITQVQNLWDRVLDKKNGGQPSEDAAGNNAETGSKSHRAMKTAILTGLFLIAFFVGGATMTPSSDSDATAENESGLLAESETTTEEETSTELETQTEEDTTETSVVETTTVEEITTEASTTTEKKTEVETTTKAAAAATSFSVSNVPEYSGDAYVAVNGNIPYFTEDEYTTEAFEIYSDLDSLGRCGVAYANICLELMPTQNRESISSVTPTGWVNNSYSFVDGGYVYNRCHLIGFQLAGENANEKNLITGTRYLNIDGMLPFENMVNDYVDETENHVLYRVTPIFEGNNLVASGVLMEGWSVEDDGDGICFCVYAYNVQPGVIIDYATGENEASGEYATEAETTTKKTETTTTEKVTEAATEPATEKSGTTYIVNTSTGKFHYPGCSSVKQMNEENKWEYTGDREYLINQGYEPCGKCNP